MTTPRGLIVLLVSVAACSGRDQAGPNDNRTPAGQLANGILTVRIEARTSVWRPDGDVGPALTTEVFAEDGRAPTVPGPLIRVVAGTEVRATVRNTLAKPLWLYGMGAARGVAKDSALLAPGESRELRFTLTEPGLFYYAGRTDSTTPVAYRGKEDSQLGGAIVVDPPGVVSNDRIFVMTMYGTPDHSTRTGMSTTNTFAFNGRAWPGTERFEMTQGDTAHWRFVNVSGFDHPLHLHGFYFRVDSKGDGVRDTVYTDANRRMAVTEYVPPFGTAGLTWSPDRGGNWIFHCHFAGHVAGRDDANHDRASMASHVAGSDVSHRMNGLVLAIAVRSKGAASPPPTSARPIRLIIRSKANVYGNSVGFSYALGGTPGESDTSTMRAPGPTIELVRGERVAVNIVNKTHEGAAVHWHGIELESYADGVPGVSGEGSSLLPMIPPGDSLTVRFTPPRTGTFMYHSHSNEFQQISSGLYGPLIVREPGERAHPNERLLIFSDNGPVVTFLDFSKYPRAQLNGQREPVIDIPGNVPVRLRTIFIRADVATDVTLLDGDKPVQWRLLSKDGRVVPASQSGLRAAKMTVGTGEIYDFELIARRGATLKLKYAMSGMPPELAMAQTATIRVR